MHLLSRPLAVEHLVARPAQLAMLDGALSRRLTLIAAQAGAGKTTLLQQWTASHPERNFVALDIEAAATTTRRTSRDGWQQLPPRPSR